MNSFSGKSKIRKTTVVLSIALVLLAVLLAVLYFCYPSISEYYRAHKKYEIYGGMTDELKDSEFFEDMQSGSSFCFMGDSITCGTETNGIQWYRPLTPYINGRIFEVSYGGIMISDLISFQDFFPEADIYVIAIGINDIVSDDDPYAAASPEDFISRFAQLTEIITKISPNAKIYYITPWFFYGYGEAYDERADQFRNALVSWCESTDCICIDPQKTISSIVSGEGTGKYMLDRLHPNKNKGVGLYSYAVLLEEHNRKIKNKARTVPRLE